MPSKNQTASQTENNRVENTGSRAHGSALGANVTTSTAPDVAKLLARIAELSNETLQHPQVVNKTDTGVASRVARLLNKEAVPCAAHRFWTGAHVLAYVAKHT